MNNASFPVVFDYFYSPNIVVSHYIIGKVLPYHYEPLRVKFIRAANGFWTSFFLEGVKTGHVESVSSSLRFISGSVLKATT